MKDKLEVIKGGKKDDEENKNRPIPKNIQELDVLIEKLSKNEDESLNENEFQYIQELIYGIEDKLWEGFESRVDGKVSYSRFKEKRNLQRNLKLKQIEIKDLVKNKDIESANRCKEDIERMQERLNFLGKSLKAVEKQTENHFKKVLDEMGVSEKFYWELREIVDID